MQDTSTDRSSPSLPQDLSSPREKFDDEGQSNEGDPPSAGTDTEEEEWSGDGGLRCSLCGAVTGSEHELTLHIRSHNEDSTRCTVCGKVLGSPSSLDRHVLVHSGERPFSCHLCGVRFTTNGNMHRHMRSHEDASGERKRKVECNNNNEEVEGKRRGGGGAKRLKTRGGRYGCPRCSRGFVSTHVLEIHLEEEHPEYSASCAQCNLVFKNYRVLNLHKFMVHYSEEDQARDLSLVEFSSEKFPLIARAMLGEEEEGVGEEEEGEEAGEEGGDPLDSKYHFLAHLDLRKSPEKQSGEPGRSEAEKGQGEGSSKGSEPEEEQDCFAWELRRMKLRGEFPCRLCRSVFPNLRALKGHNRSHLLSGEPFLCNMCPYTSRDKAALLRHMRTHNGDRPYQCALCSYAFTTKANCERHLRNRHARQRHDLKNSIIYHPSEDPTNDTTVKEEVKRSLFPEESEAEEEPKKEVGTMTADSAGGEAPLDLSMDALDLSTKKRRAEEGEGEEEGEEEGRKSVYRGGLVPGVVPKVELGWAGFFPRFPPHFPPYFVPPPPPHGYLVPPDDLKERIQEELMRSLGLGGGAVQPGGGQQTQSLPESKKQGAEPPGVKMVIKNGVLVPKQKQRRYRTERPFACDHCSARFTLRSNMERHVKQQHPQFWSTRVRSGGGGRSKGAGAGAGKPVVAATPAAAPRRAEEKISEGVRLAIVEQLRAKVKTEPDLASVSKLLDNASTQTFRQYFGDTGEDTAQEGSDEEGLVASHSEENSGSDEKSEVEQLAAGKKKASAYSLAPHRVSCPYCHRKFPWSSSLRRHVLTHTGQKPYKCPSCPLLFTTKSNCDRHLLRKHGGGTPSPAPAPAPTHTPTPSTPLLPLQEDGPSGPRNVPERPFKCTRCPSSTFSTLGNLKKHCCVKHEEEEGGGGGEEAESVVVTPLLGAEQLGGGGGGPPELPFKCHLCEGAYGERQEALDHLSEAHQAEYTALVSKGALESSAEEVDDPEDHPDSAHRPRFPDYTNRKVMCAFCLRRFWSAEDLRRHMRTHTGERPFSCDVCTRKFTLKHSMLRHRKKHAAASPAPPLAPAAAPATATAPATADESSDLIGNLLGIGDRTVVDSILEKSADDAAKLLGLQK